MRRLRGLPCVALAAGIAAAGCQLPGRTMSPRPTAQSQPSKRSEDAKRSDPKDTPRTAAVKSSGNDSDKNSDAESENPFRRARADSSSRGIASAPGGRADRAASVDDIGHGDAGAPSPSSNGWDDETRALVDAELRETPPEERAELERDLNGLSAALAQKIVTMRRLLRQMDRDGKTAASPQDAVIRTEWANDAPPLRRGESLPDSRRSAPLGSPNGGATPKPRAAGDLGRASPWDDSRSGALQNPPPPWFGRGTDGGPSPPVGTQTQRAADAPPESPQTSSADVVTPPPWPYAWNNRPAPPNLGPWALGGNASSAMRSEQTLLQAAFTQAAERQPAPGPSNGSMPVIDGTGRTLAGDPRRQPALHAATAGPMTVAAARPDPALRSAGARPNDSPAATPLRASPELQQLISQAEADAVAVRLTNASTDAERQAYLEKQVHLRMLYLVAGQQERSLQAIPGIDAADQEFWQQTFWALSNYFDAQHIPERSDRAAQTVAQLRTAVARLQETARLELRGVAFCQKIASYGSYEKFPRDEFSRGQPVLLYAEVANFKSVPAAEGEYLTRLRSSVAIYNTQGGLVERITFPETEDLCRNPRRDYFHSYQFTIPGADKIALGPHVLKLTVEDLLSQKVAECSVNLMVK